MDRKIILIAVLTVTAALLVGIVIDGMKPQPAAAQAGRFADYAMVPASTAEDNDALCVIDTVTERMIFFQYNTTSKQLEVISSAKLRSDFGDLK